MNKLIVMYLVMAMSLGAYAFFNIPQQMMNTGSQMMFPAPEPQKCTCVCDVK